VAELGIIGGGSTAAPVTCAAGLAAASATPATQSAEQESAATLPEAWAKPLRPSVSYPAAPLRGPDAAVSPWPACVRRLGGDAVPSI